MQPVFGEQRASKTTADSGEPRFRGWITLRGREFGEWDYHRHGKTPITTHRSVGAARSWRALYLFRSAITHRVFLAGRVNLDSFEFIVTLSPNRRSLSKRVWQT